MDNYNPYAQPAANVAPPRINLNTVPIGATIAVRGRVSWSHISRLYDGEELDRENKRRSEITRIQSNLPPHTRLSLDHCEIMEPDPTQPSIFGQYLSQRLWTSIKHPEAGKCYDAISKLKTPPKVYQANPDGSADEIILAEGQELAVGLDVTVFLRTYKPKVAMNNGVSFDSVVINEPVRFFEAGGNSTIANTLAAYGLTINKTAEAPVPAADAAPQAPIQAPAPAPMAPAPVPAPAPMPQQNGGIVAPPYQGPIAPPPGAGIAYRPENDPSKQY